MSAKKFYFDIDLVAVGQILNGRIHNVTSAEQTTLAASLGAANKGLMVWNTEIESGGSVGSLMIWSGTAFKPWAVSIEGDVVFRGVLTAADYTAVSPAHTESGSQYVIGEAGTLTLTGVTSYTPSATVDVGDLVLFTSPDAVHVFQRNDEQATESTLGNVRLAPQAAALSGVDEAAAITPKTLQGKLIAQHYVRQYTETIANLDAETPTLVTHGLNLLDRDAFTINVMIGNSQANVDVDSININSLSLTSLIALANVKVIIQGASAS